MTKTVLAALVLVFATCTTAQAAGDAGAGEEKSMACQGCHGADGNSPAGIWPSLAGQAEKYLVKQIEDFKSGARKNDTMESMVAELSSQDIADISAYFAAKKATASGINDDEGLITLGKKIYKGGNHDSRLMACAGCHGPNAEGNGPANFPRLGGQQAEYLLIQLEAFASSARTNDMNGMMKNIATRMSQKEMEAVAAYLATLSQ